ncbi:hypothetical protein [Okeania sp. SIO3I5]|nr:hypothetical protein [Okeania sp. SIO3I5]
MTRRFFRVALENENVGDFRLKSARWKDLMRKKQPLMGNSQR